MAWRLAAITQGVGIVSVAGLGGLWALSTNHSALETPEGPAPVEAQRVVVPLHSRSDVPGSSTFYIVGSELEATTLRDAFTEGNNIRHAQGLDLMRDEVLVVNTSAEAQLLAERLYEGNTILANFGVEDRVVNLVG